MKTSTEPVEHGREVPSRNRHRGADAVWTTIVAEPVGEDPANRPAVDQGTVRERGVESRRLEQPTVVERPTVEDAEPVEAPVLDRRARALLLALPAALVALWAVLFVPAQLGLVLGALAALPVAIVAVPWLVSVVATVLADRGL